MNPMKHADQQIQQVPAPAASRIRAWLLAGSAAVLLLMAAAVLIVPRFIDSPAVKAKIQAAVTEQTGGQVDYQGIGLSYFPHLSVELRQVTLAIPDLAEGTVAALRVSPDLLPLLTGNLHPARLELDTPHLLLDLPETKAKVPPAQPYTLNEMGKSLALAVATFGQVITGLELQVDNAGLVIIQGKQTLVEIAGMNLQSGMTVTDPASARVSLQANLSELNIYRNGHPETARGLILSGSIDLAGYTTTVKLDQLALAEPALALTGELTLAPSTPAITLNLAGSGIDVDATRRTALALAGDTAPVKEIFDYLRGGRVPQISFTSRGEDPSELGDLDNILIEGQLQDGKVSIPAISLDLTEVSGDVIISKGLLQGTGLAARLDKSIGRDGSLKIGLSEENDLFQLELMLSADLAETQSILQRVLEAPAFTAELEKITNLQGSGQGKLTLGDSLHDIDAGIEVSELNISADYQGLPLPVTIAEGRFTYGKDQLDLNTISGSVGQSQFAGLSGRFLWAKDLSLDISSGRVDLDMTELYPWLASREGLRDRLREVKQLTGRIALSALALKGEVARPSAWQFTSTGTVQDLSVETTAFPDTIKVAGGGFTVDTQKVTFEKLRAAGQDAALTLSGSLIGFPQSLERIELSLDGSMGPQSVEWLSDRLKVPESYAIHAPLSISGAQIVWQPDSTTSFKGLVSIEQGPAITADIDYHPEQLQINRLHIKDRYSEADMVVALNKDQHNFEFAGHLQHETLQTLFVDRSFGSGRLDGDFTVSIPQSGQAKVTTTGQLTGENLPIPLPSGEKLNIDQVTLQADGPQVKADIRKLTWKNLIWEPVEGTVSLHRGGADVRLTEAKLCGIDSPGLLSLAGDQFSLDMTLEGKGLDVASSYTCLTEGRVKATGSLDFSSRVTAKGKMGELVKGLKGPVELTLSNGVIERDRLVTSILEVLNVTEIVKGRLPDLRSTGFRYKTMTLQGEFRNGKLIINKYHMDGETLALVGYGEIRLEDETVDVQMMAAPFKTVDSIVKFIPGVNYLLGGSLVAIPISISGTLDEPRVRIMSASAVGTSLYNLAERTITSPFKLIDKINPFNRRNSK
jgi:hypothetical protein